MHKWTPVDAVAATASTATSARSQRPVTPLSGCVAFPQMCLQAVEQIRKFTLVAGLAMLERGSSAQLLLATLVAFAYLVLAINTSPFLKAEADRMNQIANIQIFLTLLAAIVIMTEQPPKGSAESKALDVMLTLSSLTVLLLGAGSLIVCVRSRTATLKKLYVAFCGSRRPVAQLLHALAFAPGRGCRPQAIAQMHANAHTQA